ncbi:hypothetical protein B0T21DRAFT_374013 [Apiosordaria backusii]|uniref:Ankyrin n=1 Tax=Apiosordaria backusii TaxID=314023 RepID=A0AA40AMT8_9PEZI|nr:hypothetical protein B0T21DRAFT_374013 [Apiosordaria backusii]
MSDKPKQAEPLDEPGTEPATGPATELPPDPTTNPTVPGKESPGAPSEGPSTEPSAQPPAYTDNPYINNGNPTDNISNPQSQPLNQEIDFPIMDPPTLSSTTAENQEVYTLLQRYDLDPSFSNDAPVPAYTPLDSSSLPSFLSLLPSLSTLLSLPLTAYPQPPWSHWDPYQRRTVTPSPTSSPLAALEDESLKGRYHNIQKQIVYTFFHAILHGKNTELVTQFVQSGFISPDCPHVTGQTPLMAAVEAGNGQMVCLLISLGAQVNGYGRLASGGYTRYKGKYGALMLERTPLMIAAKNGNLALVKLLMEEFGADDGIIAPDGQLALRLAAEGGHREVVEYLPLRRGGAWRRWETHHSVAVERVRRAGWKMVRFIQFFVWDLPRFFVWTVPKHVVVKPVVSAGRYCWENKRKFGGWAKRQVKEFPGRVKRCGKAVWKVVKKLPGQVWDVVKGIPGVVVKLGKFVWKAIKKIPEVMKNFCVWIWTTLKKMGVAVGNVFLRIVSVLHTAVAAVLDFFRSISLKDIWNGVKAVFEAIFVVVPKTLWSGIVGLGKCAVISFLAMFGLTGQILLWIVQGLWWVVKFIPRQLGKIIDAIWASISKGYYEIMVWINPKH